METKNLTSLQRYLNNISNNQLSYTIDKNKLIILHSDFVSEVDLKTDKMTVYTIDRQRINELDIELICDLHYKVGILSSFAHCELKGE